MPYVSPGAAFTSSLEQTMLQQAAARRQAELDQQEAQQRADAHQLAEEHLKEMKDDQNTKAQDKKEAKVTRSIANMVPGDIPDAALIADAKAMGIPIATNTTVPAGVAPEVSPVAPTIDARRIGGPAPIVPPVVPQPIRFAGTPVDRKKALEDQKQADYIKTLPADSPERKALEYEQLTGKPAPAGMFKSATSGDKMIMRQHPTTGAVESMQNGKWVPYTGNGEDIQGAHWMTEPAPKDHSGQDARENTRRDNNYKTATTFLEKLAVPLQAHVDAIEGLGAALDEHSTTADTLIAPLILKATVSGAGTGFRMTQAEINQVVGGRSKWDDLKVALSNWESDPKKVLRVTEDQRNQMRSLAKAIRAKAAVQLDKISKAQHDLDDADNVDEIHSRVSKLKDELYAAPEKEKAAKTTADYMKMLEQP